MTGLSDGWNEVFKLRGRIYTADSSAEILFGEVPEDVQQSAQHG